MRSGRVALLLVLLALLVTGCPKKDEVVVQTSAGKGLTAAQIDKDETWPNRYDARANPERCRPRDS